jgi:hypothetical protein
VLAVVSGDTQVVQELHLVTSHLLCEYLEQELPAALAAADAAAIVRHVPGEAGSVRAGVDVVLDGGAAQQVDA